MLRTLMGRYSREQCFSRWLLPVAAGILLSLAFPRLDWIVCAWVGFIPLFFSLEGQSPWQAAVRGYLAGFVFFLCTVSWLVHVTLVGMLLLVGYFALYFAAFAWFYSIMRGRSFGVRLCVLPAAWVVADYIRVHLFLGFDGVHLAHSQTAVLPLIQIADLTGVFGVSFLVVLGNVCVYEWVRQLRFPQRNIFEFKAMVRATQIVVFVFFAVCLYGMARLYQVSADARAGADKKFSVAVVQGNIPQSLKWQQAAWPQIMDAHVALTRRAAGQGPDLIVWPETSFPGLLWSDVKYLAGLQPLLDELRVPLLLGSVLETQNTYYNAAVLFDVRGLPAGVYKKKHLMPFGEYLPLRSVLPFLGSLVPIVDCLPGTEYTLFPLTKRDAAIVRGTRFAVLICVEDTLADFTREFVRAGAEMLINITNDAWFGDTRAPFLHMRSALFRAIENRRPLVRAANTGVSCFIDAAGRVMLIAEGVAGKKTFVEAFAVASVVPGQRTTFYTKHGDVFTYVCAGCILIALVRRKRVV